MAFSTLMYHEIRKEEEFHPEVPSSIDVGQDYDDILPSPLFVTLEHFEEQMSYLQEQGYHTLTLDEVKGYYNGAEIPEKSILLTFDDCYQSIKRYAYPILKKYNFHAVAFVVSDWLHATAKEYNPKKSVCMTKEDLTDISDVFEYANHTKAFHQRTNESTSLMMEASDEEFAKDLDLCNEFVQVKDVFAYPFGLFNDRNVSLLKKKGFILAFTSETGLNDQQTDPLRLKRNAIPYFIELDAFKKIIG